MEITGDEEYPMIQDQFLSQEQIDQFIETGILVVPNLIPKEFIQDIQQQFHEELLEFGVDHDDLINTGHNLHQLSSTGGAGGILDLFYSSWRMKMSEHPNIFNAISDLWKETYAKNHPLFQHPYGSFNPKEGYMYINRVCYRLPDHLSKLHGKKKTKPLQRSLTPHLDCCPTQMYKSSKEFPRWRPIQCMTALTSNFESCHGGFEAIPSFHKEFYSYFNACNYPLNDSSSSITLSRPVVCVGDFSPLRTQEDASLINRFQTIPYDVGSVIFFDYRIPHANSYSHVGNKPREVIYTGFLPNISINQQYAHQQLKRYQQGLVPIDHWQNKNNNNQKEMSYNKKKQSYHFNSLGSRLIGLYEW